MLRKLLAIAVVSAVLTGGESLRAFTLDGPAIGYETTVFGYDDGIAYPRNIGDESRIVVPNLYYACDATWLDYFGAKGREDVNELFAILNAIPPYSSMSEDLSEFPLVTYRENFQAGALGLTDVRSTLMALILEELGLLSPERYMWSMRARELPAGAECPNYNFIIIMRNFDPVEWRASSYVNGTLYTFDWVITCAPAPDFSYPVPTQVDPTAYSFSAIARNLPIEGIYYAGLTRDDIAGLRYIYRRQNYNFESWPATVTAGTGGGGTDWGIVGGSNTNAPGVAPDSMRGGVDKLNFEERPFDSLLGQLFIAFTNQFTATIYTNNTAISQQFQRAVAAPDIVFAAADLAVDFTDVFAAETVRPGPFYSNGAGAGPGVRSVGDGGTITYRLNKIGETYQAGSPSFLSEFNIIPFLRWGSFDGTTNAPVYYPQGSSIRELESQILAR